MESGDRIEKVVNLFFYFGIMYAVLNTFSGIQLDVQNKKYRHITSISGIKYGKWKPLPKIVFISVLENYYDGGSVYTGNVRSATTRKYLIKILPEHTTRSIIVGKFSSSKLALKNAKRLAKEFKIDSDLVEVVKNKSVQEVWKSKRGR